MWISPETPDGPRQIARQRTQLVHYQPQVDDQSNLRNHTNDLKRCPQSVSGLKMINVLDYPLVFFLLCLVVMWLSARTGAYLRRKRGDTDEADRHDLDLILGAALTLLALIIGFSFSMAVSRYDQRKNYEEEEANAIGTEYARAGLLPAADAAKVRALLKSYLDQRILFYTTRSAGRLEQINARTAQLQTDLWSAVEAPAAAQPTPVVGLAVAGMNDVLNSQGYTQAAWWNRIPIAAWCLMGSIAICCNLLAGYDARTVEASRTRVFILPLIVAISFLMIADLDVPHAGVIRVHPQNLESLARSLPGQ